MLHFCINISLLRLKTAVSSACNNINNAFRLDNIILKDATAIYAATNDGLGRILFASAGYYSDGNIVRYWTGTEFTTINRCSEFS